MIARFVGLALLDLAMNLVGRCLNWLFVLIAGDRDRLPGKLGTWFGQHDSTLDGEEIRFIQDTMRWRDTVTDAQGKTTYPAKNKFARWLLRTKWLNRNNAYGFSYWVIGAPGPFTEVVTTGTLPSDRYPAKEGELWQEYTGANGVRYFQWRYVKDRGNGQCIEARIGWKIASATDAHAQLVMRWTPFRTFETTDPNARV